MTKSLTGMVFNIQRFSLHDGPGIRGWDAGTALPGSVAAAILSPEGLVYVESLQ